jgi:YrbI family 3-deoxy-D-manno-octulosonate 8-phosphate phosphatase
VKLLRESLSLIDFKDIDLQTIHSIVFDFDGVFTNNKVWVDQNGREVVCCDRSDGLGLNLLKGYKNQIKWDVNIFTLSTETNPVVSVRMKKLGINCYQGITNKLDFLLTHFSARFSNEKTPFKGLIYVGNDLNDLPVMRLAQYSIAPIDAHSMIKDIASCVLPEKGGEGFVRNFVEKLINLENLSKEKIDELIFNC